MGFLTIKCHACGGKWEVYRSSAERYDRERECPHCGKRIDRQTWEKFIAPAWRMLDEANRELFKDHLGYHTAIFTVEYTENGFYKDSQNRKDESK